jgi:hypothetical protein
VTALMDLIEPVIRQRIERFATIRRANRLLRELANDDKARDLIFSYGVALWWLKQAEHAHHGELEGNNLAKQIRAGVDPDVLREIVEGARWKLDVTIGTQVRKNRPEST